MRKGTSFFLLCIAFLGLGILAGCTKAPTSPNDPNSQSKIGAASPTPSPTATPSPTPTTSPSPVASPTPTASPDPTPSPTMSPAPGTIPFAVFFIEEARVELDRESGGQRFEVEGLLHTGEMSNGIDVLNEDVIITFASFRDTIPAGSFIRDDDNEGFEFKNESGIKEIKIREDGKFEVEARDLDLNGIDLSSPVHFFLQIGDDFGETDIQFNADGRFKNPDPKPSPNPSPTPTASPSPSPSPTVSPSPNPSPTTSPSPNPSPTASPSPNPSPSPTVSPSPSPSPTVSPSPSPSPEIHLRGSIQALTIRGANDGDVTVQGVKFVVTSSTLLEDDDGNTITLNKFSLGDSVDAWGPPAVNGATRARRIRKDD